MSVRTLPGTTIELPGSLRSVHTVSASLFLAGGLTPAQVCSLTNLPLYVLHNWARRGFIAPPLKKVYEQDQFYRIAIINFLKEHLRIETVVKLIEYATAPVAGAGAEPPGEAALYHYFAEALFLADRNIEKLDEAIETALRSLREPYAGARKRLALAIRIMIILYISSQIKDTAGLLLRNIGLLN